MKKKMVTVLLTAAMVTAMAAEGQIIHPEWQKGVYHRYCAVCRAWFS